LITKGLVDCIHRHLYQGVVVNELAAWPRSRHAQVRTDGYFFDIAALSDSKRLCRGEIAIAIGNPLSFEWTGDDRRRLAFSRSMRASTGR
jgi:hypothetical protein